MSFRCSETPKNPVDSANSMKLVPSFSLQSSMDDGAASTRTPMGVYLAVENRVSPFFSRVFAVEDAFTVDSESAIFTEMVVN